MSIPPDNWVTYQQALEMVLPRTQLRFEVLEDAFKAKALEYHGDLIKARPDVRDVLVPIRQRAIEIELSKRERRQEVLIEYLRDPISDAAAHTRDLGTVQGEIIELHTIYKNVKDRDELLAGVKKLRIPGDPARKCRCKKTRGGPCEHEQGA